MSVLERHGESAEGIPLRVSELYESIAGIG